MKNDNGVEGIEDIVILQNKDEDCIKSYRQTIPVNFYHYYINDDIGHPDRYIQMINTLKTVEEHDTVFIYLNTPGGRVDTAVQIIGAMKQCKGTVVTSLEGEVCSAGTMIFLSGTKFYVNPYCSFMIHNYSAGFFGKGNELSSQIKYREKYFKQLMFNIYDKFLTEEEIEAVIEGKDFWFSSNEVIERLKRKVGDSDIESSFSLEDFPKNENNSEIVVQKKTQIKKKRVAKKK